MMNKIVADYANVKVIHHDFPLDNACNPLLEGKGQMHENSCLYSQYILAAKKQNKAWGLTSKMFANNQDLSEDKVLELSKSLGLDIAKLKKDAHSKAVKEELKNEIDVVLSMNITATPTYMINGKKYEGIFKYPELVKIVKENGGIRK